MYWAAILASESCSHHHDVGSRARLPELQVLHPLQMLPTSHIVLLTSHWPELSHMASLLARGFGKCSFYPHAMDSAKNMIKENGRDGFLGVSSSLCCPSLNRDSEMLSKKQIKQPAVAKVLRQSRSLWPRGILSSFHSLWAALYNLNMRFCTPAANCSLVG